MFTPSFRATGLASLLAIIVCGSAVSADRTSPKGIWIDDNGRGAVEIKDCEGDLCGRVVWLKSAKNADRCNLQILGKLTPTSDGKSPRRSPDRHR